MSNIANQVPPMTDSTNLYDSSICESLFQSYIVIIPDGGAGYIIFLRNTSIFLVFSYPIEILGCLIDLFT